MPDGEVGPPGTKLALGEPTVVPILSGTTKKGIARVTVRIEKGTAADLKPLDLDDRAKGMVPYYVWITFEKIEGKELAYGNYASGSFRGLLPDGSWAGDLILMSRWDKCPNESAPVQFDHGKPYETCKPFLAAEASRVASVAYEGGYGTESEYQDKPIIWE